MNMAQSTPAPTAKSIPDKPLRLEKSHDILTCTVKAPPFSYAHLEVATDGAAPVDLDELQVRAYCTAALRQFLGATGAAVPLDILKVRGGHCWVRVPRPDLGTLAAAVTAWRGTTADDEGDRLRVLRVKQCSDWLGTMVGGDGQDRLWDA